MTRGGRLSALLTRHDYKSGLNDRTSGGSYDASVGGHHTMGLGQKLIVIRGDQTSAAIDLLFKARINL